MVEAALELNLQAARESLGDMRLNAADPAMQQAHLADPFAAVDTSNTDPYPHQIDAVYNRLLAQRPLRFLLADDPGAGKTIMSGLLIRELVLRGDVARCLIVAPGSLVEQWQDELWDKFGLSFELMSRAAVEASRTNDPFTEKNLLIARVDQLSRSEELMAKVQASDWDLVIVDEAHKMSAHRYGDELRRTKRFVLGRARPASVAGCTSSALTGAGQPRTATPPQSPTRRRAAPPTPPHAAAPPLRAPPTRRPPPM